MARCQELDTHAEISANPQICNGLAVRQWIHFWGLVLGFAKCQSLCQGRRLKNGHGKVSRTRHACQNLCQDRFEHPSTGPHLALAARWSHFRRRGSHSVQVVDLELNRKLKRTHTLRCHTTPLFFLPCSLEIVCVSRKTRIAQLLAPRRSLSA